ncbi:MAG: IS110 family transposase [Paracoccaceae bacterium]
MNEDSIGIDISKDRLDVWRLSNGAYRQFANSQAGLAHLLRWVGSDQPARVVFEASGTYHRRLERQLGGRLALCKVNPWQARRFAEAQGLRAKTDRVDARMLAEMGAALALEPDPVTAEDQRDLKALVEARRALVTDRTRQRNRLHALAQDRMPKLLSRQIAAALRLIEGQITALDSAIEAMIGASPTFRRTARVLRSIPGIGAVASVAILSDMPEIGQLGRKQAAALAGLAPMTRRSGQWQGHAAIAGGRKPLRDALYMPALTASRKNPELAEKYRQLIAAGKPAKLALTCIMRKLLELANALVKADREWSPKPA